MLWMSRWTSLELGHAVEVSRAPAPFPASLPWPVLTRAEALRAGVSPGRLRAPDLARLRPGLLVRGGRTAGETEIVSAYCRSDPEAVAVGLTAARMQGMPLPEHLERSLPRPRVHISLPQGRVGSDPVVRWHQFVLPPDQVREARFAVDPLEDGSTVLEAPVRLTTRARTWRDLAPDLSEFWLIAIGDHLVRRPRPELEHGRTAPWCTLEELREQCTGRHAATLRAALRAVRVGADSPRETMLRLAFARAGLPDPLLNTPLIGPDGRQLHEPDFQWPAHRVCAEYDGRTHSTPGQVSRDIRRARRVQAAGWTEVRLHSDDIVQECAPAVDLVRAALGTGLRGSHSAGV